VSDLVDCLIFIALGLMLVHTVFVTVRFFRRYFLAWGELSSPVPDSTPASQRSKIDLVANLSRGVEMLQSIARTAPFLGLAGTCYGILCLFARGYIGWRGGFISELSLEIPVALVATAAGLIVAVPAAISYNILRTCLERFENNHSSTLLKATPRSYGFAQTLPLRSRFSGLQAFALIGAPVMALLIPIFVLMLAPAIPVGLPVHILKLSSQDHNLPPLIVSVIATNEGGRSALYVRSKETSWDELGNTLRNQLKVRPHWVVYVEGEDYASWRDVVNVIDVAQGLHAEVVLLTAAPNVGSDDRRSERLKGKVPTK
jgi:biopolymer transport protein ExbD